jgi:hydroxyacylglutathione hydrolase
MLNNMDRFANLPKDTHVYCAHEYTLENLKFLSTIDVEGVATSKMLNEVTEKRDADIATVPTTIGRELEYNLFMKCREEKTQQLVNRKSPVDVMARLRELKNQFRSV